MKWLVIILLAGIRFAGAWTTTINWPPPPPPATYPTGYLSESTSSTFTGPATVAFDWRLKQSPAPEWAMYASSLAVKVDGVTVTSLAPNRGQNDDTMHTGSVTIPAG